MSSGAEIVVTSLPSGNLVATIPLSFTPYSLILSPDGTELYVSGTQAFTSAFISIISTASNSVTSTLTLNVTPDVDAAFPMAVTPDGTSLFLAAGGLVQVNTSTLAVSLSPSPGSFSQGIAVTPNGAQLWFGLNNSIEVLNTANLALITTISASGASFGGNGLMITPDGTSAILANDGLRAFDTTTFLETASITTAPFAELGYLAPGRTSGSFLVTNTSKSFVLEVSNSFTLLNTYVQSGQATTSVAVPGGNQILASNGDMTGVGAVNSTTGSLGPTLPAGCEAGIIGINSALNHLYIPDRCSQDITFINLLTSPATERVFHGPVFGTKVVVSPNESRLYAADLSGIKYAAAGTIEVLDSSTGGLITTLSGSLTIDIALSADGSKLYVDDNGSAGSASDCPIGGLCVFDTSTFELIAQVPNVFGTLALSQDGNTLYVGPSGTSIAAINTSTFAVSTISLPVTLVSLGGVAVRPGATTSAVVFGNESTGGVGFLINTSTNTITEQFPVPTADLLSAAFAPNGTSLWFLSGTAPAETLVEESFPAGAVVTQTPAQGTSISFFPAL